MATAEERAALAALAADRAARGEEGTGALCEKITKTVLHPAWAALSFAMLGVAMGMAIAIYVKLIQAGVIHNSNAAS